MGKFKVGDRVQFKSWQEMKQEYGLKYGFNEYGDIKLSSSLCFSISMKHLCNTFATIQSINEVNVELTDFTDRGKIDWHYTTEMLKLVKSANDISFNKKVVVLKQGGKTYKAICSPDDKFDLEKGIMVCLLKSKGIKYPEIEELTKNAKTIEPKPKEQPQVKEVHRMAKVGEYIKIDNSPFGDILYDWR